MRYEQVVKLPPGVRLVILWLCLTSILVSGCALHNAISTPVVEGFIFHNQTRGTINNVHVKVPDTGEIAFCSHIPPGGICASTIRARRYQGNSVNVDWKQGGKDLTVRKLALGRLDKKFQGESVRVLMTFGIGGSISVRLIRQGEEWK